jgi:hypothetical protein
MRFEHMDANEALQAHLALEAKQSFGVQWGTLHLGDEGLIDAAVELTESANAKQLKNFGLMPIRAAVEVVSASCSSGRGLTPPLSLDPSHWMGPRARNWSTP